jgi:hypothetical protein
MLQAQYVCCLVAIPRWANALLDVLSCGSGRDWFLANTDGANRDPIIDLAQNEFVDDVDI